MKKLLIVSTLLVGLFATNATFAQEAETVSLVQTEGEFETKQLTLEEGTYIFEVTNQGVDHPLGFVLAPKGKTDEAHHIKAAYVQKAIEDGETSTSQEVTLEKGEYEYFCPLNPTPHYTLVVE